MMDSSTQTPSHKPYDHNREHVSSPHHQNEHGINDDSRQSSDLEKTLKMILMKLRHSTSTHNPKNINHGDVDYYQGQDHNNNEMFMKMIHSNPYENKHTGQYKNHPGSHGDNHGQYGNSPSQYGNNHGLYGNNHDQYGNNHGQYGNNPGQYSHGPGHFSKNPEQFGNANRGPDSNPGQYGSNQGLFNPNPGQYGQNPGSFNPNPGQYGNNPGQFNPNPGQYGSNQGTFNPNQGQYGNNQGAFNPNPGQFNYNPGPYNAQLQDIRTTTVAPSTTSATLAALEDQRRKQSIQQGIAVSTYLFVVFISLIIASPPLKIYIIYSSITTIILCLRTVFNFVDLFRYLSSNYFHLSVILLFPLFFTV